MSNQFTLLPTSRQVVSPMRFLQIIKTQRDNVESSHVVPPRLGQRGFGRFVVKYKAAIQITQSNRHSNHFCS